MILKVGNHIEFYLKDSVLRYQVCDKLANDGYFLSALTDAPNDIIFTKLGIKDKYEFCRKHTDVKVSEGIFPVIKTLEGLAEVVQALFREIEKQNPNSLHNIAINTNLNIKKHHYKLKFSN